MVDFWVQARRARRETSEFTLYGALGVLILFAKFQLLGVVVSKAVLFDHLLGILPNRSPVPAASDLLTRQVKEVCTKLSNNAR